MLIVYIASFLGILWLLMAAVAVAADSGPELVFRALSGFIALLPLLYLVIEGVSAGGLRALTEEPLLGVTIFASAAAAYSLLYVWLFVSSDPLRRLFDR